MTETLAQYCACNREAQRRVKPSLFSAEILRSGQFLLDEAFTHFLSGKLRWPRLTGQVGGNNKHFPVIGYAASLVFAVVTGASHETVAERVGDTLHWACVPPGKRSGRPGGGGHTVEEAAGLLHIVAEIARLHLKSVLQKKGA